MTQIPSTNMISIAHYTQFVKDNIIESISDFLEISDPVITFDQIMKEIEIAKYLKNTATLVGRKGYNSVNMLKTILGTVRK